MTPRELAEKIFLKSLTWKDGPFNVAWIESFLAEALADARMEERALCQREIDLAHRIVNGVKEINEHIFDVAKEAKAAAYEAAADLVASWAGTVRGAGYLELAAKINDLAKESK